MTKIRKSVSGQKRYLNSFFVLSVPILHLLYFSLIVIVSLKCTWGSKLKENNIQNYNFAYLQMLKSVGISPSKPFAIGPAFVRQSFKSLLIVSKQGSTAWNSEKVKYNPLKYTQIASR